MRKLVFAVLGAVILPAGIVARSGQAQRVGPPDRTTVTRDAVVSAQPAAPPALTRLVAHGRKVAPELHVSDARRSSPSGDGESFTILVKRYCVICHNDQALTANLTLAQFEVENAQENPEIAEKMIRKLTAGMMPPTGMPRPGGDTLQLLAHALEQQMDALAAANPNPGHRTFQRLNRAEYARSVHDIFGFDVDVSAFLPTETMSHNFDNIADVQTLSPTLMEGYLRAAGEVSRLAVGDPEAGPSESTYKVPRTASQLEHVEGAPIGTRGGISVVHTFPADGDYIFKIALHPGPTGFLFGMTSRNEQLEVSVNGERVAVVDIDRWMTESDPNGMNTQTPPIHVRAGPQRISAAFISRFDGPVEDIIAPIEHTLADTQIGSAYGITTLPHLRDLTISGPHGVTGVSETPSRRLIFSCRPTTQDEEIPCAKEIISRLATEAYRRPLNQDDIDGLMQFYRQGAALRDFESGIQLALQAVLASPHFVFRIEEMPSNAMAGRNYRIGDIDLASRLSFFLWSTAPDDELIAVARKNELHKPDVLDSQVRRMLADPRAETLATRFVAQWLRLQDLEKLHPDALLYPQYDATLGESMRRETELFVYNLLRENRSVMELLTADYTFVDERLARHYGIPNVTGEEFRRVHLDDPNRRGLLGQGSILALTSHADRTSPVLRGKWVMEVFYNSPPPPPPPNVPAFEQTKGVSEGRLTTVRERMEEHRANPVCQACHRMMDPIGLALENFDVTGAWRIKDSGMPIDAAGQLYDGTPIGSPIDLRNALLKRPEAFVRTFATNMLAYGLGRRVEWFDMPAVRKITRAAAADDYRFTSFVLGVVNSPAFQMSRAETVADQATEGH
jgi:Protein of unknown function (DUF1592)/Protein of unknown function (DUF1588)/Protein of unknown function (DUF1595)/Protein of unknown function (DUF1585)/Protein of unknown function (DUF1587)